MAIAEAGIACRDTYYEPDTDVFEAPGADVLAITARNKDATAARWHSIIDHTLIEWGSNSSDFGADGLVAPSPAAISKAYKLIVHMRGRDWPLPTGIVADGEGGVVFENKQGPIYQRIEIDERGHMKLITFHNGRMIWQESIDVE